MTLIDTMAAFPASIKYNSDSRALYVRIVLVEMVNIIPAFSEKLGDMIRSSNS